jgi:hypothetical protein
MNAAMGIGVQFEKVLIHAAASARRSTLAWEWKPFKRFPNLFLLSRTGLKPRCD